MNGRAPLPDSTFTSDIVHLYANWSMQYFKQDSLDFLYFFQTRHVFFYTKTYKIQTDFNTNSMI